MINKDTLIKYFEIISGCDTNTTNTLVHFSLSEEKRNIINLVNNEAKKNKKLANLLEDLKYSNNKTKDIEKFFEDNKIEQNTFNCAKERINNYGFINLSNLGTIVGIVTMVLALVITLGSK